MNNDIFNEMLSLGKNLILWIITTIIFTTEELRDEAQRQFDTGTVRISGIFYGFNLIDGYKAIGRMFPEHNRAVKADYISGYIKVALITACVCGSYMLLIQYLGK